MVRQTAAPLLLLSGARQGAAAPTGAAGRSTTARVLALLVAAAGIASGAGFLAGKASSLRGAHSRDVPQAMRIISCNSTAQEQQQQQGPAPPLPASTAAAAAPSPAPFEIVVPDTSGEQNDTLPHIAAKVLALERQGRGRKIIAFSLYGSDPKYTQGAIENAMLVERDWPGWTCRVYVGAGVPPKVLDAIRLFGGEVVVVTNSTSQSRDCSTFWRFFAALDRTVTRVIMRDADSRLTKRDFTAVQEWMNTTHYFHVTHDHPYHDWVVMAGAWGTVNGLLHPRVLDKWRADHDGKQSCTWGVDQTWLRDTVWALVRPYSLQHASYHCGRWNASEVRGWPRQRENRRDMAYNVHTALNDWLGLVSYTPCPKECRRQPDWEYC